MVIERDADEVCAAFLLERELFESGWTRFAGEVSGVIAAGAFVGSPASSPTSTRAFCPRAGCAARTIRPQRHRDRDRRSANGRRVRLGDPVEVRVDGVEAPRGRVDLVPAPEGHR